MTVSLRWCRITPNLPSRFLEIPQKEHISMTPEKKKDLRLFAIRVRESILKSIQSTKSGRPGGSLSAADYFTYLYQNELRIDPTQPRDENRDRFVFPGGMLPQPIRHTGLERFLFRRKSAASAPYSRPSSGASQHEHYPPAWRCPQAL